MNAKSAYHSPLRDRQAAATRARILEACVSIMQSGGELTYAAVSASAEVQERTVYRYFPTRRELQAGLWSWILDHLTHVDFSARTTDELVTAMRSSFAGFDDGAPLIQAMLHSRDGLEVRVGEQPRRRAMFEACVDQAVPGAPPDIRLAAAAALQVLYSAPSWELLRSFWAMDAAQAADVIELAIRSLLSGLQMRFPDRDSERAPPAPQEVVATATAARDSKPVIQPAARTERKQT